MEEQALLKLEHCTSDQADQLLDAYRELKAQTCAFVRIELCAECSLQLTFGVLLLTFSRSNTRTQTGLEAVFNENKPLIFGIPPVLLIVFNYLWNIFSAWRSFVKGMSSTKDHFHPARSDQKYQSPNCANMAYIFENYIPVETFWCKIWIDTCTIFGICLFLLQ